MPFATLLTFVALGGLCLLACKPHGGPPAPSLKQLAPAPLTPLTGASGDGGHADDRDAAYRVQPAPVFGAPVPVDGQTVKRISLSDGHVWLGTSDWNPGTPDAAETLHAFLGGKGALLATDGDTYMVQVAALLAALDDAHVKTWLLHPAGAVAFPLVLRDEAAFGVWLDEAAPGKVRVIQREDGLELATSVGKLPGPDPSGPSVPVRSGQLDVATLREGLTKLRQRFTRTEDLCVVPSFGTELTKVATVLSGTYRKNGEPFFPELCFVYPRPKAKAAEVSPARPLP